MNPPALALAAAASWGTSDFLGGVAARRVSPYQAVAVAHLLSLAGLLSIIFLLHFSAPPMHGPALLYGLLAGVFGGSGLIVFYQALSLGSMGLTAALCGVLTAAVPVLYGLGTEGLPQARQLVGFSLAIGAIWLIASAAPAANTANAADDPAAASKVSLRKPNPTRPSGRSLGFGAMAGLCFGIYFVLLKWASAGGPASALASVLWATAWSRVSSSVIALALCVRLLLKARPAATPEGQGWSPRVLLTAAAVGLLDTGANILYMLAAHTGRVDIAGVLTSLYPAVTILLAAWVLHERTSRTQTYGMLLALAAVGLIAS